MAGGSAREGFDGWKAPGWVLSEEGNGNEFGSYGGSAHGNRPPGPGRV